MFSDGTQHNSPNFDASDDEKSMEMFVTAFALDLLIPNAQCSSTPQRKEKQSNVTTWKFKASPRQGEGEK